MASNFFTNQGENTLYNKFAGVFEHMQNIEYFKSVIGYFRASGYFVIRKHFPDTLKVKIIAGINVDPFIALAQKQGLLFNLNAKDAKQSFYESIQQDILNAKYGKNIEEGILQLIQDIGDGRIEIRAHNSKKLHSKFYIFLSPNFNSDNPNNTVIMGSSNLSAQGLGLEDVAHNYEMNIQLSDYTNVKFANDEFELGQVGFFGFNRIFQFTSKSYKIQKILPILIQLKNTEGGKVKAYTSLTPKNLNTI